MLNEKQLNERLGNIKLALLKADTIEEVKHLQGQYAGIIFAVGLEHKEDGFDA